MDEELAMLTRIRLNPGDATAKLVYADWLQERGDPRADLIRIEDELRRMSVFDPGYWSRKQIRNDRRSSRRDCRSGTGIRNR